MANLTFPLALLALMVGTCLAVCTMAHGADSSEYPAVRPDHPRLGLRPDGTPGARTIASVRDLCQTNETLRGYLAPALLGAEEALKEATEGKPLEDDPLRFAVCWVVTGEDRFADAALRALLDGEISVTAKSSYYSDVWQYGLAYDWLFNYPGMTEEKRTKIEERIAAAVVEELVELDGSYSAMWHGRNQLGNNTLVAALSLSVHPRAEELQRRAMAHFAQSARALALTQGWPEGPSYWMYNRQFPYALATDCYITATGQDHIAGVDLTEMIRQTALWHLYAMRPDGTLMRFGDAYSQGPGNTSQWQHVQDYFARICRDPAVVASADYFRTLRAKPYHRALAWTAVLSYDPDLPMPVGYDRQRPADYLNAHLPKARLFGRDSIGQAFFVERWGDPDATWIGFNAGDVFAHHGHYDQGAFEIFRGSPLAVHSGTYETDYFGRYRLGYYLQTVSVNSLLVHAPGEFSIAARQTKRFDAISGGQRVIIPTGVALTSVEDWRRNQHAGAHYEAGDIVAFESAPDQFDYVAADITAAYNSTRYAEPGNPAKVSSVVRKLAYLRQTDAVVVLDRVVTTDPGYSTRWLLHLPAKPQTAGETQAAGQSADDGILSTRDRQLHMTFERGQLFHQVVLPRDAKVLNIGGPHYRHWVELEGGGAELEPDDKPGDLPADYGLWRTEVVASEKTREHLFLNVLWPRAGGAAAPPAAQLLSMEAPGVAVAVGAWVMVFASSGEHGSSLSYQAPPGTEGHLIVDLSSRSWWRVEATDGAQVLACSGEGVLSFSAGAGPIRLTELPSRGGAGHQ